MNDAEKKKYEEELQTMKEKQKKHEPVRLIVSVNIFNIFFFSIILLFLIFIL